MAYNNWSVASKVRKESYWNDLPIIGTFMGLSLPTSKVKIMGSWITFGFILYRTFPVTQALQAWIAALLTVFMGIYMMLSPGNPEQTNWSFFVSHSLDFRRPRKYKPLSESDFLK